MRSFRAQRWTLTRTMGEFLRTACLAGMTLSLIAASLPAGGYESSKPSSDTRQVDARWHEPLSADQRVWQLLNRTTFGARPGDFERVKQMGLEAFLDEQLHPDKIDDSAVEARLAKLQTLNMTSAELVEDFPPPRQAKALALNRAQPAARETASTQPREPANGEANSAMTGPERPAAGEMAAPADEGKGEMSAPRELSKPQPSRAQPEPMPRRPREVQSLQGPQRVVAELAQEELLRAVYSNRQLEEVMVQFWMNHFNIFANKGPDKWMLTSFERDAIRPYALGKFENLLVATAESPAMLFYLDNWMSATPNPTYAANRGRPARRDGQWHPFGAPGPYGGFGRYSILRRGVFGPFPPRPSPATVRPPNRPNAARKAQRGLNENYGRELMELHTLGVDGGYTQKDVIEVARCFTGWTIDRPRLGGGFIFRPEMHDFGTKVVLGHKIKAGHGMEDGLEVLHLLAHEPATAHHIAYQLAQRFVADNPPESVVGRAAQTFLKSDGDIRAVLKTILASPEFYSQAAYRAKVKSPLELVASSMRALGADTDAGLPVIYSVARMGQPMFQYQAPSGYPDRASTWINSGTLLTRIKFAGALAANRLPGTQVSYQALVPEPPESPDALLDELAQNLMGGQISPSTRGAILKQLAEHDSARPVSNGFPREVATLTGLLLASPEFQKR